MAECWKLWAQRTCPPKDLDKLHKVLNMTDTPLARWRSRLGLTQQQAANAMGMTRTNYQALEYQRDKNTGAPLAPSKRTRLAAAAIEAGIRPIGEE